MNKKLTEGAVELAALSADDTRKIIEHILQSNDDLSLMVSSPERVTDYDIFKGEGFEAVERAMGPNPDGPFWDIKETADG